jgi:hypothetical protein
VIECVSIHLVGLLTVKEIGGWVLTLADPLDGPLQVAVSLFDGEHEIGVGPVGKQLLQCGQLRRVALLELAQSPLVFRAPREPWPPPLPPRAVVLPRAGLLCASDMWTICVGGKPLSTLCSELCEGRGEDVCGEQMMYWER